MSKKQSLSRLSSTASTADLSSRSFVFRSLSSGWTDNNDDDALFDGVGEDQQQHDGCHEIVWGEDDPEECVRQKKKKKKSRPLSSFANKRLSDEGDDDDHEAIEVQIRKGMNGSPYTSATRELMEKIAWRRCLVALTVLGILCVIVHFSVQKAIGHGNENDVTTSFVSSNGTTSNNNYNDNSTFDAGQEDGTSEDQTVQDVPMGNHDPAPSMTPTAYLAVGTPHSPPVNPELHSISPRMETNSPSITTTADDAFSIIPPTTSSPTVVVANSPSTSSPSPIPSTTVASPLVSSPTDLPGSFTVTAPSGSVTVIVPPSPTMASPTVPVSAPTLPSPTDPPIIGFGNNEIVVLYPDESMEIGVFRSSPNGVYKVGLTDDGDLVLKQHPSDEIIWSAGTAGRGGNKLSVQPDGNLILRDGSGTTIWTTNTYGYPGARLVVDDGGQVAVKTDTEPSTTLWLHGIPRGSGISFTSDVSRDIVFPVRGAFYYPWYPQTWFIGGHQAHYDASLGLYSSSDPAVARSHIDAMNYAHIKLGIASWWGPDTHLDRARLTMLMDQTVANNSPLQWTVYHEDESIANPSVDELKSDLEYLKKWFVWHEKWAFVDGLPVIFVYNEAGCSIADRWAEASGGEWHVVLKLFPGFEDCSNQPGDWHQYGVGEEDGTIHNEGHSFILSPGFWRADTDVPLVPRVGRDTWCNNARRMVESGEPYQLIVSFNEAGEGTMIEPSPDWESDSGFGYYLDCLHDYP